MADSAIGFTPDEVASALPPTKRTASCEQPGACPMSTLESVNIGEVWQRLGGDELRRGRGRAFWRGGDGWSVSVDVEGGRWFDFVAAGGGGVLMLAQTALSCDRSAALAWLEAEGFIEPNRLPTEERREYARKREAAVLVSRQIEYWRVALGEELNARKASAAEIGDFEGLERAARLCHLLENGSPAGVAREFFRQWEEDRDYVEALIEAERQFEEQSERMLQDLVDAIARSAGPGALSAA